MLLCDLVVLSLDEWSLMWLPAVEKIVLSDRIQRPSGAGHHIKASCEYCNVMFKSAARCNQQATCKHEQAKRAVRLLADWECTPMESALADLCFHMMGQHQ